MHRGSHESPDSSSVKLFLASFLLFFSLFCRLSFVFRPSTETADIGDVGGGRLTSALLCHPDCPTPTCALQKLPKCNTLQQLLRGSYALAVGVWQLPAGLCAWQCQCCAPGGWRCAAHSGCHGHQLWWVPSSKTQKQHLLSPKTIIINYNNKYISNGTERSYYCISWQPVLLFIVWKTRCMLLSDCLFEKVVDNLMKHIWAEMAYLSKSIDNMMTLYSQVTV